MGTDVRGTNLKGAIPKIYKRQWLDAALFGWVSGQKNLLPSVTIDQCIEMFMKHFDLSEDDISHGTCRQTYNRMVTEMYDDRKS